MFVCAGDIWIACERRLFLGHYFSDPQDQWLRMHFFKSCVAAAQGLPERAAVQAQLHMAEMHLERGGHTFKEHSTDTKQ